MLSRTADHLYWMSRYLERAECLARMLDAHHRLSMLPRPPEAVLQGWMATLVSLGMEQAFHEKAGEVTPRAAFDFIAFDREYPGSIVSCLRSARENARAVRGTVTSDVWETLNATYLESRAFNATMPESGRGEFLEWVKYRAHLTRGVSAGTMVRDEALWWRRRQWRHGREPCLGGCVAARGESMARHRCDPSRTDRHASLPARRWARLPRCRTCSRRSPRRRARNDGCGRAGLESFRPTTYCVAMLLDTGLVFLSDSRTNAGIDQISTFRKTTVFQKPGERVLVRQSSGNLAITQTVASMLKEEIDSAAGADARACAGPGAAGASGAGASGVGASDVAASGAGVSVAAAARVSAAGLAWQFAALARWLRAVALWGRPPGRRRRGRT
jgi:hypothetical protein